MKVFEGNGRHPAISVAAYSEDDAARLRDALDTEAHRDVPVAGISSWPGRLFFGLALVAVGAGESLGVMLGQVTWFFLTLLGLLLTDAGERDHRSRRHRGLVPGHRDGRPIQRRGAGGAGLRIVLHRTDGGTLRLRERLSEDAVDALMDRIERARAALLDTSLVERMLARRPDGDAWRDGLRRLTSTGYRSVAVERDRLWRSTRIRARTSRRAGRRDPASRGERGHEQQRLVRIAESVVSPGRSASGCSTTRSPRRSLVLGVRYDESMTYSSKRGARRAGRTRGGSQRRTSRPYRARMGEANEFPARALPVAAEAASSGSVSGPRTAAPAATSAMRSPRRRRSSWPGNRSAPAWASGATASRCRRSWRHGTRGTEAALRRAGPWRRALWRSRSRMRNSDVAQYHDARSGTGITTWSTARRPSSRAAAARTSSRPRCVPAARDTAGSRSLVIERGTPGFTVSEEAREDGLVGERHGGARVRGLPRPGVEPDRRGEPRLPRDHDQLRERAPSISRASAWRSRSSRTGSPCSTQRLARRAARR